MAIRILFDHQIFVQKFGGISRYYCELIKQLDQDNNFSSKLWLKSSGNEYILNLALARRRKVLNFNDFCFGLNFKGKSRLYNALERIDLIYGVNTNRNTSIRMIRNGKYDVFHPTYYDPYFLEYLNNKPFVLTIYDMIYELYPEQFPAEDSTIANKRSVAEKANAIIAISENTKQDIIKLYGIDAEKIKVIYLGNSLADYELDSDVKLPEKYILYIGNRFSYKNFRIFVKAIAPLLRLDNNLYLVCGGGNIFSLEETNLFKDLSCENKIIYQKFEKDRTLVSLYRKALAFIFPSLYEGFGIPVLESFACGCPAILSNSSSLPEVALDAAEYFNPVDEFSIMNKVKRVIYDEKKRSDMRSKGFERLKYFSWEKNAFETKKIYESLI
ncbi:MAG: glycosyltransferase family 1 protein [Lentisphaerota bacterium]